VRGEGGAIENYKGISKEAYMKLFKHDWSFKDESLAYLSNDLLSHYQIMIKFNKQVFLDFKSDLKDSLTISSLAARVYLTEYYVNNIPTINKASIYKDIKEAYYGGITEVYKPFGVNLFYYDVNSLYPYVSHQPMPGLTATKVTFYNPIDDLENLFGFFYCKIKTPQDGYLGLLPVRLGTGLNFPLGCWYGWYFSEELKFAKENGYSIEVLKGYNFNKEYRVFDDYISDIYKLKSNSRDNTQRSLAKSLLNNLLGRFGISLDKPITNVVSEATFDSISILHKIMGFKEISDDKFMISYTDKLDPDLIREHGLDLTKILLQHPDKETQSLSITSVAISAAITAYARIHMSRLKLDIIKLGGNIYYSDTDSIVTDKELPNHLIHPTDIGLLKLEHKVKKGIFISGKLYALITDDNKIVIKSKGINSESLKFKDFEELLNNQNIHSALKTISKISWEVGPPPYFLFF
jgi:hypothetical protein